MVKDLDEPTSPKGRVTGYQPAHDWYAVQFEDGDQEYLMRDELQLLEERSSGGKVRIQAMNRVQYLCSFSTHTL